MSTWLIEFARCSICKGRILFEQLKAAKGTGYVYAGWCCRCETKGCKNHERYIFTNDAPKKEAACGPRST